MLTKCNALKVCKRADLWFDMETEWWREESDIIIGGTLSSSMNALCVTNALHKHSLTHSLIHCWDRSPLFLPTYRNLVTTMNFFYERDALIQRSLASQIHITIWRTVLFDFGVVIYFAKTHSTYKHTMWMMRAPLQYMQSWKCIVAFICVCVRLFLPAFFLSIRLIWVFCVKWAQQRWKEIYRSHKWNKTE